MGGKQMTQEERSLVETWTRVLLAFDILNDTTHVGEPFYDDLKPIVELLSNLIGRVEKEVYPHMKEPE